MQLVKDVADLVNRFSQTHAGVEGVEQVLRQRN